MIQIQAQSNVVYLTKENQINKVLKEQKKERSSIKILFTSLWDPWSKELLAAYNGPWNPKGDNFTLYVVDSFNMPHSFVIFKIRNTPALVSIDRDKIAVETYLPFIYTELGC